MRKIIVSACLAGINCRYDGKNNYNEKIKKIIDAGYEIVFVCPEQLGGLATPRPPAEIKKDKVFTKGGRDVTYQFQKGANETLKIAELLDIKVAILKGKSPSCGSSMVYDGTFSNKIVEGEGVTSKLLKKNGIKVINEYDLYELEF